MNCTVDLRPESCDIWVGTQVPALAQGAAAKLTGLPLEKVRVHNHYIGGGFGRRLEVDFISQAVAFAKQLDKPLKVVWTREEDIQHECNLRGNGPPHSQVAGEHGSAQNVMGRA